MNPSGYNGAPAQRKPVNALGVLALLVLVAGGLAWVWLGEWRWAATGALVMLVLASVGASFDRKRT